MNVRSRDPGATGCLSARVRGNPGATGCLSARARRRRSSPTPRALAAVLLGGAVWASLAVATGADAPATDTDWKEAIDTVSRIALDASSDPAQRSAAVLAAARMRVARGADAEALKTSRAVFDNPGDRSVATAAIAAASLAVRQRRIDLVGLDELLADWAKTEGAASRQAASIAVQDISRSRGYLAGVSAQRPVPDAIRPTMPPWGRAQASGPGALTVKGVNVPTPPYLGPKPTRATSPLVVKLPVATPPAWYRSLRFAELKEDAKK